MKEETREGVAGNELRLREQAVVRVGSGRNENVGRHTEMRRRCETKGRRTVKVGSGRNETYKRRDIQRGDIGSKGKVQEQRYNN